MGLFRRRPLLAVLVAGAIAFALTGCATPREFLDWDPGHFVLVAQEKTGWKGVRGDETLRRIYAKQGETSENWTEKAEVTDFPVAITLSDKVSWNPESVMNSEKVHVQKKQCSTDTWTVLQKDDNSILYEWKNISCPGRLHQHEIARIVMGRWYLWMISYGIRNKTLSSDERTELIENLLKANVVRDKK